MGENNLECNVNIYNPLPIEQDVDVLNYPSILERYYTLRYIADVSKPEHDYCILFHSNRLCILTLAPSHPIITLQKKVLKLDFQISEQINRLNNKMSGKRKHGAQWLKKISLICVIQCADDSKYNVLANIPGKLLEINENLINNPQLLQSDPMGNGFIAIILPEIEISRTFKNIFLNSDQYADVLEKRKLELNNVVSV